MKTYIVYPAPANKKDSRFGYSVSCLTLATIAGNLGEVQFVDMTLEQDPVGSEAALLRAIKQETGQPTNCVVFFDSVPLHRSSNVISARMLCDKLKSTLSTAQIIACGPYCMIRKTHEQVADITIVNEPECSIDRVLRNEAGYGCLTRQEESVSHIRLLKSLDNLAIPNRSLLPPYAETPFTTGNNQILARSAVLTTTRGCLGSCRFCPRGAWNQHRVRHRTIEKIIDEIRELIAQGYRNIWLDDENMGVDVKWSIELFKKVAAVNPSRKCGFYMSTWGCVPEKFFEYAFRAGVRIVSFGVESGSDNVLEHLNKPIRARALAESITHAHANGLFTVANIIIGTPCETDEDLHKTIEFLRTVPVDDANIKVLSYIRGAPLWDLAVKEGLIKDTEECVFADARRGLSNRNLDILFEQQKSIRNLFAEDKDRLFRLSTKIARYGPPYMLQDAKAVSIQ